MKLHYKFLTFNKKKNFTKIYAQKFVYIIILELLCIKFQQKTIKD